MVTSFVILIIGFAALVWSADRFVYGAAALAKNMGIPTLIIGLTVVAMGSSAPEMMVSASAALANKTDTAVGNAIGSNITNILLVLGVTALLRPLSVSSMTLKREMPLVLIVSIGAWYVFSDNYFSFAEGIALILAFAVFIAGLVIISLRAKNQDDPFVSEACEDVPDNVSTRSAVLWLVVGMILLPISSHFLVGSAVDIAKYFGLSDLVIGLTIIAIGTSLPELAACIAGVLKNEDDLALGNIVGSNIFNLLAVLPLAGIINPSVIDPSAANRDALIMIAATIVLIAMSLNLKGARRINRIEGGFLLVAFIAYQGYIFSQIG
ncbi:MULTISPECIES: calcium/sodium antiporter [Pseudoalteromonas]|jgi:cation:H+ antiporter|uniref:Calcium/sodium antiporter n=1 Tax=Pseudoalteromonas lipolytica TaxID=570156 RepID=A0AAD0RWZ2_9GAMM|nr:MULTISPECIES: calcium/sodium antiporter [Pseudoalteromonas]AXV64215.1 calcium/sodium antiporter [Pseudoalteromonas donghaensis]EWH06580.1 calcium/sodium:proton antiporter [Pseudoalteromonas lipolytica SCSIO 04301]MAE01641.1 calcium/sodium antiporter [Pseudoalteromonas sp.]MBE0352121.1 cation:H+ antiporter [Pseudoalteromonas lipolytica LMEB 39]QLJ08698.1 calcium/sodium antiporter [Pseudoalteromonas sp. JSTW]|tara:strand:+ start:277 stop:1245 length:969 start_codon:yes stop_codon:yes gene_type:complete